MTATEITFDEYQVFTDKTAIYPEAGECTIEALLYCALGLGEAGEIQNKVKKILRGDCNLMDVREQLIEELGDLQYYVARMATELRHNLSTVASINMSKLADRQARGVLKGSGDNR